MTDFKPSIHVYLLSFQCLNTQLVDTKRSFKTCSRFSLPSSPVSPPALSGVPFSNRRERKTSKCPHFAGDIWAFFCLCLLYIPVTLGTANRPPFLLRSSTLPLFVTAVLSDVEEWNTALPVWTITIKLRWRFVTWVPQIEMNTDHYK